MEKLDLYKLHKADYAAPLKPVIVDIKAAKYLSITGRGEPGGATFQARLGALYNVAFTIKMDKKFAGQDYAVCKLEGLWWGNLNESSFLDEPRQNWNWKLVIRTPDFIQNRDVRAAVSALLAKGRSADVSSVTVGFLREGRCVQVLHIGPYDQEARTIGLMQYFAAEAGLEFHGLHTKSTCPIPGVSMQRVLRPYCAILSTREGVTVAFQCLPAVREMFSRESYRECFP